VQGLLPPVLYSVNNMVFKNKF